MKLLKLILITGIILQCTSIVFGKNGTHVERFYPGLDTNKHSTRFKGKIRILPPTRAQALKEMAFNDCKFVKRYTVVERLKQYPFSKALKILAVSYPLQQVEPEIIYKTDSTGKVNADTLGKGFNPNATGLHIKNGKLNYASLKEIKYLNHQQINSLTNILYNTTYKRKSTIMVADPGASCFNPRNAIIFIDKNGKIFDYLEVCFECKRYDSLFDKISIGTYCNQKYELLKQFLIIE